MSGELYPDPLRHPGHEIRHRPELAQPGGVRPHRAALPGYLPASGFPYRGVHFHGDCSSSAPVKEKPNSFVESGGDGFVTSGKSMLERPLKRALIADEIVIDAATNVAVLVLAINLSNPARPNLPIFEYASLQVIFGSYALLKWVPPVEYPFKVVFVSGTWEQVRLLTSVLFLRIATGGLLQAIVLTFSEQSELRIGIIRSKSNLDLDEPSSDSKGDVKPRKKFAVHINVALIFGGAATILAAGLAGGVFVALVKARDAFAVA